MLEVKAEEVPIEKGKSQDIKAMWFCCNYNLKSERVYITDELRYRPYLIIHL